MVAAKKKTDSDSINKINSELAALKAVNTNAFSEDEKNKNKKDIADKEIELK